MLELRQGGEDMEDELAAGAGGVDLLLQAHEADALVVKHVDRSYQLFQGPAEPIQPPDNQGVALAHELEGLGEAAPEGLGPAGLVGEDLLATRLGEGVVLQGQVLVLGGDSSVADEHDGVLLGFYFVKMTIRLTILSRDCIRSQQIGE